MNIKRFLTAAAVASALAVSAPGFAVDTGVSVSIGQPGFYGRIDIGNFPAPQLIYPQPILIERVPMSRPPVYLHVPPGHAKHWSKHCHEYNACGERVFFVQDSWYSREYVPRYQTYQRERRDERGDERNDDNRRGRGNGHRDDDHDHEHGHGRGRGRDH